MLKKTFATILFLLLCNTINAQESKKITLKEFIEQVKEKNESIKKADSVNVMINDLLIENHDEYKIDPKNVSRMEILVIEPEKNTSGVKPSIIISTKIK